MYEDADHKQALCSIPILEYGGKKVKQQSYHMIVKYLYSYRGPTIYDEESVRYLDTKKTDLFNVMDLDRHQLGYSVMIDSTALKELSFSTVVTLFSSRHILIDDEIPIEQLLEGIKAALTEHKILLELIDPQVQSEKSGVGVMPNINVISKADFDKLLAASSRANY